MSADTQVASVVIAALLTVWVIYDVPSLREAEGGRSLWIGMAAATVSLWVRIPLVYQRVEQALGPGWGTVIFHAMAIVMCSGAIDVLHLSQRRPHRVRVVHAALAGAAVVVSVAPWLVAAPSSVPGQLREHVLFYASTWQAGVHWAAVTGYMGWAMVVSVSDTSRSARTELAPMRTGVALVAASTALGIVDVTGHAVIEVAWLTGARGWVTSARTDTLLDTVLLGAGVPLLGVGVAWTKIVHSWEHAQARRQARTTALRVELIRPHWARLAAEIPEVSPFAPALLQSTCCPDELQVQQSRMAVEVYDVMRRVMCYLSDEDHAMISKKVHVAGLRGHVARASTESICLQMGLWRRQARLQVPGRAREPRMPSATDEDAAVHIAADLRRIRRRRARRVIADVLREEAP